MLGAYLFDSTQTMVLGALFGFLFGFFLRRAKVTQSEVIVGQLLLQDFTVMKVIFTAILVGGAGIYAMLGLGMLDRLLLSQVAIGAAGAGGIVFGIGMAVLGYCPGTAIAALADGARDVWFGLAGMACAIASYAELFPWIQAHVVLTVQEPLTLATATGLSPWGWLAMLAVGAGLFFTVINRVWRRV